MCHENIWKKEKGLVEDQFGLAIKALKFFKLS